MSAEFEAAQEICAVLNAIDQNLDRIYKDMPSQRERIATAALQGMLAAESLEFNSGSPAQLAERALLYTDALIAALNKPQTGE